MYQENKKQLQGKGKTVESILRQGFDHARFFLRILLLLMVLDKRS